MSEVKKQRRLSAGSDKYRDETIRVIRLIRQQFGTIKRFCLLMQIDEVAFRHTLLKLRRHRGIYENRINPTPEQELEKIYKLLNVKKW